MDPKMCLNIIWMDMKIEVHWPLIVERGEIFIIFLSNGIKQTNYEDICIHCFSSFNGLLEIQVDAQTIY